VLADFPAVSPHFSRTPVHGERDPFPDGYDFDSMLAAARLLEHAKPKCRAERQQGAAHRRARPRALPPDRGRDRCAGTTSTLALMSIKSTGVRACARLTLRHEYQTRPRASSAPANMHAGRTAAEDNLSFAVPADAIAAMLRSCALRRRDRDLLTNLWRRRWCRRSKPSWGSIYDSTAAGQGAETVRRRSRRGGGVGSSISTIWAARSSGTPACRARRHRPQAAADIVIEAGEIRRSADAGRLTRPSNG
jgi:hypothetical protein